MGEPIAALGGRTWEELEVREHADGQLMFPAVLRKRNAKGETVETKVRVRVPAPRDQAQARIDVREWFRELKLDPKADSDIFEQLEQVCVLARAIRVDSGEHPQLAKYDELSQYDEASLQDIQEQINAWKAKSDPRKPITTPEEAWRTLVAVAKGATIDPLLGIAGRDQPGIVVLAATEACRSPTGRRWLASFGISIPDSSPSTKSDDS